MIFSYRKWIGRLHFLMLFMALTLILYHIMVWLENWVQPRDKYREPYNQAVKAFTHASLPAEQGTVTDRLKLFYWYGE
ncbi:DUF4227 family protein [Paenibacillus chartarius]|uniref:DUF4227 family protein n=1 Tax=Paenibacillus chartarius TaxID=747481 RepID=A0ABV6DNN2_9BACL